MDRSDPVLANQKVARLLAGYFDILFALNRMTHPGEKRLLTLAAACEWKPPDMPEQVRSLLQASCSLDREHLLQSGGSCLMILTGCCLRRD